MKRQFKHLKLFWNKCKKGLSIFKSSCVGRKRGGKGSVVDVMNLIHIHIVCMFTIYTQSSLGTFDFKISSKWVEEGFQVNFGSNVGHDQFFQMH